MSSYAVARLLAGISTNVGTYKTVYAALIVLQAGFFVGSVFCIDVDPSNDQMWALIGLQAIIAGTMGAAQTLT